MLKLIEAYHTEFILSLVLILILVIATWFTYYGSSEAKARKKEAEWKEVRKQLTKAIYDTPVINKRIKSAFLDAADHYLYGSDSAEQLYYKEGFEAVREQLGNMVEQCAIDMVESNNKRIDELTENLYAYYKSRNTEPAEGI